MLTRFIIYGITGWCIEVLWTGLGSLLRGDTKMKGWTYLWMFPIYGLAVFLESVHNNIRNWPFFIRGAIYTILIFSIEFFTGWLLDKTIGLCPWNYGSKYSIKGFIRLDYAPLWFIAGLLFEILHNTLDRIKI